MGTHFSSHIAIGYLFTENNLFFPFEKYTEEVFHMEKRFDQKTGKELSEVKIIDKKSSTVYLFNKKIIKYSLDFIEEFCKNINCKYSQIGDLNSFKNNIVLSPECKFEPYFSGDDFGNVRFGDSYKLSDINNSKKELKLLKNKLESFGLKVSEPGVFLAYCCG